MFQHKSDSVSKKPVQAINQPDHFSKQSDVLSNSLIVTWQQRRVEHVAVSWHNSQKIMSAVKGGLWILSALATATTGTLALTFTATPLVVIGVVSTSALITGALFITSIALSVIKRTFWNDPQYVLKHGQGLIDTLLTQKLTYGQLKEAQAKRPQVIDDVLIADILSMDINTMSYKDFIKKHTKECLGVLNEEHLNRIKQKFIQEVQAEVMGQHVDSFKTLKDKYSEDLSALKLTQQDLALVLWTIEMEILQKEGGSTVREFIESDGIMWSLDPIMVSKEGGQQDDTALRQFFERTGMEIIRLVPSAQQFLQPLYFEQELLEDQKHIIPYGSINIEEITALSIDVEPALLKDLCWLGYSEFIKKHGQRILSQELFPKILYPALRKSFVGYLKEQLREKTVVTVFDENISTFNTFHITTSELFSLDQAGLYTEQILVRDVFSERYSILFTPEVLQKLKAYEPFIERARQESGAVEDLGAFVAGYEKAVSLEFISPNEDAIKNLVIRHVIHKVEGGAFKISTETDCGRFIAMHDLLAECGLQDLFLFAMDQKAVVEQSYKEDFSAVADKYQQQVDACCAQRDEKLRIAEMPYSGSEKSLQKQIVESENTNRQLLKTIEGIFSKRYHEISYRKERIDGEYKARLEESRSLYKQEKDIKEKDVKNREKSRDKQIVALRSSIGLQQLQQSYDKAKMDVDKAKSALSSIDRALRDIEKNKSRDIDGELQKLQERIISLQQKKQQKHTRVQTLSAQNLSLKETKVTGLSAALASTKAQQEGARDIKKELADIKNCIDEISGAEKTMTSLQTLKRQKAESEEKAKRLQSEKQGAERLLSSVQASETEAKRAYESQQRNFEQQKTTIKDTATRDIDQLHRDIKNIESRRDVQFKRIEDMHKPEHQSCDDELSICEREKDAAVKSQQSTNLLKVRSLRNMLQEVQLAKKSALEKITAVYTPKLRSYATERDNKMRQLLQLKNEHLQATRGALLGQLYD
ncbi:MAG: hypothetical protein HN411_04255 [Waddliaceae bacterium]|jgi:hypothetical protein|nr:hypothetical protein [Waddliaceae bacterium]MBT3579552.1 hypothetical protein [Waddliaceae bacterium]MBT4445313.1 hypothetical protein [Waddliaceae bacterium]MBT6928765.1 hypothetical protein [Waddliaceae bacterium]MBT7263876.1 hypothetical protein [Waddliaceae bacterium]